MKSTYYDFSQHFDFNWFLQSIFHKNVSFYWDKTQKVWCRRIKNVKGWFKKDGYFYPDKGQLVSYKQNYWAL